MGTQAGLEIRKRKDSDDRKPFCTCASTSLGRASFSPRCGGSVRSVCRLSAKADIQPSRAPLLSRNSIPHCSRVDRVALIFRDCIESVPSIFSAREIADCETPHRLDRSRTDQLSSARAARNCAPVIGIMAAALAYVCQPYRGYGKQQLTILSGTTCVAPARREARRREYPSRIVSQVE